MDLTIMRGMGDVSGFMRMILFEGPDVPSGIYRSKFSIEPKRGSKKIFKRLLPSVGGAHREDWIVELT